MKTLIFISFLILASCASGPEPIYFGEDGCKQCMMTISDPRFASTILTDKYKTYKFDAIECAVSYIQKNKMSSSDIKQINVTNFFNPSQSLDYNNAIFVVDSIFKSPMGLHIAAMSKINENSFFETYKWDKLLQYVDKHWKK